MKQITEIIFCKPFKVEKIVSYFTSVEALEYNASLISDWFLITVMLQKFSLNKTRPPLLTLLHKALYHFAASQLKIILNKYLL